MSAHVAVRRSSLAVSPMKNLAVGTGAKGTQVRATQRLQLHKNFTFDDARAAVPYFSRLGISHLYVSPILTARAGSMHGYDVVDYGAVNPELGGEPALRELVSTLREHGMGLVVDIVPNHMAVGGADNKSWLDLLEWGRASRYANFFDVDWDVSDPALHHRVLAPFLGKSYGEVLAEGELKLQFDAGMGRFYVSYFEHRFPITPTTYRVLLRSADAALASFAKEFTAALVSGGATRGVVFEQVCLALATAVREQAPAAQAMEQLLANFDAKEAAGRQLLHSLLERQHYRLAWWRTAADEINWRRFFDVISLAGVRIELPAAFEIVHATIFRLYADGLIDGVRIDHIDGLADPRTYCHRLRTRLRQLARQRPASAPGGAAYFIVEKILARDERLPDDWRVDGTTGYSFMNDVGALLHAAEGEAEITALWTQLTGRSGDFETEERRARRRIPQELLAADFNACAFALHKIARSDPTTRDWTLLSTQRVLAEILVQMPVYRTYADARGRSDADNALMAQAIESAAPQCRPGDRPLLPLVDRWLGGEAPNTLARVSSRRARLRAIGRFQQLSSPVAAKSVEDTSFYRHGRLLSRNEVGANPAHFALSAEQFHAECLARTQRYPNALLATATHDHKRGEDLRARLAVLSEIAPRWAERVQHWRWLNASHKLAPEQIWPDSADEYMLYQMLVGAWPLDLIPSDTQGLASLRERIGAWQVKALREAKRFSSWAEPNVTYEAACADFLAGILDPGRAPEFLTDLHAFVQSIAAAGAINSLSQTLLKYTSPGVPDLYQGCEFWDYSLVDPDNRRPVDFAVRAQALAQPTTTSDLFAQWRDGRIKQQLIARALSLRQSFPDLFSLGDYTPLTIAGKLAEHLIAFARSWENRTFIVVAVRFSSGLAQSAPRIDSQLWRGTQLVLPDAQRNRRWSCALSGAPITVTGDTFDVAQLLNPWPLAMLIDTP